jgi:hypothetical protein
LNEWKIGRVGRACQVCGKGFAVGEDFVSAIFQAEEDGPPQFERLDACPGCFDGLGREPFSRWRTRLPPEAEKQPLLDLDMARDFLLRLASADDPEQGNLMHILTLLLLRKRKVKLLAQRVLEGRPVMELVVPAVTGDVEITVPATTPGDEETAALEAEVARLFGFAPAEPGPPASDT